MEEQNISRARDSHSHHQRVTNWTCHTTHGLASIPYSYERKWQTNLEAQAIWHGKLIAQINPLTSTTIAPYVHGQAMSLIYNALVSAVRKETPCESFVDHDVN